MQQLIQNEYIGKPIKVRLVNGSIVTGHISGRYSPLAHVTWTDKATSAPHGIEVEWETIVVCLNNKHPILI